MPDKSACYVFCDIADGEQLDLQLFIIVGFLEILKHSQHAQEFSALLEYLFAMELDEAVGPVVFQNLLART